MLVVDMVKKGDLPKVSERLPQRNKKKRTGSLTGAYADACQLVGAGCRGKARVIRFIRIHKAAYVG